MIRKHEGVFLNASAPQQAVTNADYKDQHDAVVLRGHLVHLAE